MGVSCCLEVRVLADDWTGVDTLARLVTGIWDGRLQWQSAECQGLKQIYWQEAEVQGVRAGTLLLYLEGSHSLQSSSWISPSLRHTVGARLFFYSLGGLHSFDITTCYFGAMSPSDHP